MNKNENEPTMPGEQFAIDATIRFNDRVRERRFAKGLPCLLTGLTKEQWHKGKPSTPIPNPHVASLPKWFQDFVKNDEYRVFEEWLIRACPSGDATTVQEKWKDSAEFKEHLDWSDRACAAFDHEVARRRYNTIMNASDWIERIAQRHSELSGLFLDGFQAHEFRLLASKLREILK